MPNGRITAEIFKSDLRLGEDIGTMILDFNDPTTYSVSTSIDIAHSYHFVNNVFDPKNPNLAELYKPWKRCLAIVDYCVYDIYGDQLKAYFKAHNIAATIQSAYITEDRKNVETLLECCRWMTEFNVIRREPVLIIGGGLLTDVVGLARKVLIMWWLIALMSSRL